MTPSLRHGGARPGAGRPRLPSAGTERHRAHLRLVARAGDPAAVAALPEHDVALVAAWCLASSGRWHEAGLALAAVARRHHGRCRRRTPAPPRPHPRLPDPARGGYVSVRVLSEDAMERLRRRVRRFERRREDRRLAALLLAIKEREVLLLCAEILAPPAAGPPPPGDPVLNCTRRGTGPPP